jgi:hypothetical protein
VGNDIADNRLSSKPQKLQAILATVKIAAAAGGSVALTMSLPGSSRLLHPNPRAQGLAAKAARIIR